MFSFLSQERKILITISTLIYATLITTDYN